MTENEVLEMLLDIKEIQVDQFDVQDRSLHIHCSSVFEEALCPHCLKKRQVINQTYVREFRDLSMAGKEVYLHLSQRQFYCPDCHKHFNERFQFVDPKRKMTRRYERHVYECCKASTIQKISAQENLVWETVNEICQRGARKELEERPVSKIRAVGMDEFAIKKGHRHYATVIVDLERVEIIDILEYRDQAKLIEYFKNRGVEWCEGIEVFCSDMWQGFINTAKAVFPHATLVVDRFHFFSYLNKAVDSQRKNLRRQFKDQEDFKRLKWALLKNAENLTPDQKKKLDRAFLLSPQLKLIYEHKEKFRAIFNQHLTREQGEIELNQWIEEAKKMKNNHLNKFLYMLNDWKEYVLNYFTHRVTTSVIEGINNSIKTVKRMGYGFRNFANFKQRVLISFA
jgi:transposase